ncbi:protein downstream neighbor of son homolog [Cloeon dipterum]|uniref:protein downstream neighbor of son homolog n=1 Tax=Cloeon dipterum TaxID=197152 RepID=UPI00321FC98B
MEKTAKDITTSPTTWTRPADVMKLHRQKQRKRALQSRLFDTRKGALDLNDGSKSSNDSSDVPDEKSNAPSTSNPFRSQLSKRFRETYTPAPPCDLDSSCDTTLFQLLNNTSTKDSTSLNAEALSESFANFLDRIAGSQNLAAEKSRRRISALPLDWSLKYKIRFFSKKQLPWSQNLKMLDEASGTTAFARCVDLKSSETSPAISTGINAQLHQTCLAWQHPNLPWVSLFPRTSHEKNRAKKSVPVDPVMKDALHNAWRESFRSLLQLVRAHQCPFFYLCANKFTCLIRAAGIGGIEEIHAVISPTTTGFRKLLLNDEICYSMPLQKESSSTNNSPGEQSSDGQDEEENEEEVDDEGADEWLQSIGVGLEDIKKLNSAQNKVKASKKPEMDLRPASTIVVQTDAEVMALFNLLLNYRSITTTIGALAGIPPTLLAPVAFHGATLTPLTVGQKTVNLKGEQFYSAEIVGPVLPHTLRELCRQLEANQTQFSMTCSIVEQSKSFSMLPAPEKTPSTSAFALENLRDCGLTSHELKSFCQHGQPAVLSGVKFENSQYVCHD